MNSRLFLVAIVAITSLMLSPARAQLPPGGIPTGNPRDRATEDKIRSDEMERIKRDAEKPEDKALTPRFPAIKEDFEQIQLINNDVLQTGTGGARDYKLISAAADEIKQRATRLKTNMFPATTEKTPPTKRQAEREANKEAHVEETAPVEPTLKSLLAGLDSAIQSFVSNPVFTNLNVVDVQKSAQARLALEQVIKLSTLLGKEADRLRKTSGN